MTRTDPRDAEQGMILINVLMFVAIAAGLVLLMINREELALERSLRLREASRAAAIVQGGELSAISALARDQTEAPKSDDASEPWAGIGDTGLAIEGGIFDLAIADAQGRFNLNNLHRAQPGDLVLFGDIATAAGLTPDQASLVAAYVADQPVTDLRPLQTAGFDPDVVFRLETMVTALPGRTPVNLNAAPPELLAILFHDPEAAGRLAELRASQGFLTGEDLAKAGQSANQNSGFQSNFFWVRTRATIGSTVQQGLSLIQRRNRADGVKETVAVARWLNAAVPPGAPEFVASRATSR